MSMEKLGEGYFWRGWPGLKAGIISHGPTLTDTDKSREFFSRPLRSSTQRLPRKTNQALPRKDLL